MKWFRQLFSDSSEVSAMRVMAMLSLVFGMVVAAWAVYCHSTVNVDNIVAIFVGAAFTGKVGQKYLELKGS